MTSTHSKTYSELERLRTFDDRFEYLRLGGGVGEATFGFDRHVNQQFYSSVEWQQVRNYVIVRDDGCDLGIPGYEIGAEILIHHMNPMGLEDILRHADWILDPEYLITTTHQTHNAIHYGARNLGPKVVLNRSPGDTRLW